MKEVAATAVVTKAVLVAVSKEVATTVVSVVVSKEVATKVVPVVVVVVVGQVVTAEALAMASVDSGARNPAEI